jgi:prophage regulatory protein
MRAMLRLKQVMEAVGLGKSSIWEMVKSGLLPQPVRIGLRAVAWPSWEIETILDAQVAGCSRDDIRVLVSRLAAERSDLRPATRPQAEPLASPKPQSPSDGIQ